MECGVRVEAEDPLTGIVRHVNSAYLVFVAVDERGRPRPVPPLVTETERRTPAAARGQAPPGAPDRAQGSHRGRASGEGRGASAKRVLSVRLGVSRVRGSMDVRPGRTALMTSELAGARTQLETSDGPLDIFSLPWLAEAGIADVSRLPHTVKILLENLLRRAGSRDVADDDVRSLARWPQPAADIAFMPGRVLMQDFTGVPAVVDLAAMRSAVARADGDPASVNPLVPVDLIIDHSVQVDLFRTPDAYEANIEWEYRRNGERYALLRWAQQAFDGLRVVPPGAGICHQVNLEHLGQVVSVRDGVAFPDTLMGTDSHTTMINGLGVLGWGVGGIEAEAAMLGQPTFLPQPDVVGVQVTGGAAAGHDRDRSRPHADADAPRPRGRRPVRRVLRGGALLPHDRGPGDPVEHVPRIRGHVGVLPRRRADARVPPIHGSRRADRPGRALHEGAGAVPHRCRSDPDLHRDPGPGSHRASNPRWRDLADRRTASRSRRSGTRSSTRSNGTSNPTPSRRRWGDSSTRGAIPTRASSEKGWARGRDPQRSRRGTRLRGDRGDHVVHQHVQPVRDGRRRAAREAGRRRGPGVQALGQDLARARLPGRHRLPGPSGADALSGEARIQPRGIRVHDVHRELRPASGRGGEDRRRREAERGRRPVRQPELRRAHPPAGPSELPGVATARGGVRPRREGSTSIRRPSRSARARTVPCSSAISGRARRRWPR